MTVIITGMGCICALGNSIDEVYNGFQNEDRNTTLPTLFQTDIMAPCFEVKKTWHFKSHKIMRTLGLTFDAVDEALKNADLDAKLTEGLSPYRVGVCIGTTVASQLNDLNFYKTYRSTGHAEMAPVDQYLKGNLAEAIAQKYNLTGPTMTVVNACSSGTDALGIGLSWIGAGICDIVIAGGADELNQVPLCGFNALGIVSGSPCRPFDRDRNGLNLGEGAGIVILESENIAKKRQINAHVALMGYGSAADAYHLTAPRPDGSGLKTALQIALDRAQVTPKDVAFINAHGTATPNNDLVEGNAIYDTFGPNTHLLSTKGYTGHTLGAAGGLEAVFTALGLEKKWIPKSIGFENKDPEIPITPICEGTDLNKKVAVSTAMAFGGNNAALIFKQL